MCKCSAMGWITSSFILFIVFIPHGSPQHHYSGDNAPPIITVDRRSWEISDIEEPGSIVARVRASDPEDDPLAFSLQRKEDGPPLPFAIDNVTGVIRVNESLKERGGETFMLYVVVSDGRYDMKNEVFAEIVNTSAKPNRPPSNRPFRPVFYPPLHKVPGSPLLPVVNKPDSPPLYIPSSSSGVRQRLTTSLRPRVFSTTPVSIPSEPSPDESSTTASDVSVDKEFAYMVIPVSIIGGLIFTLALVLFLFRRRIFKNRNKIQKDDLRKDSSGGIVTDDTMAMQHWRGPRAFSNRYEGWDSDRMQQPPPIPGDHDVKGGQWEFPRHRLKVFNILGEGCFGQVWRCEAFDIDGKEGPTVVAVKTLKENAGEKERSDLVQELEVMKQLEPHPNVVRLLGCCTDKDPLFVIMEFVANGKLQSYLRDSRAERYYGNMHGQSKTLTSRDLTSFAYQCARGMDFLSSKGIIHRDLAARNILVSEDQTCKVADFGFARDIASSFVYERKSEGKLPIRWMAPESLYDNIFTVKSDVWGFGVLVWEMVTLGSTPYPGLAAADVMRRVRDGYRLEKPDHCRRELYNIMFYCWDKDPNERPSFPELVTMLEQLLLTETDYIELERFPDHSYYNMVSLSGEKL